MTDLPMTPDGDVRDAERRMPSVIGEVDRFDGATPMTSPMRIVDVERELAVRPPVAGHERDESSYTPVPTAYALASAPRGGRFAFAAFVLALAAVVLAVGAATALFALVPAAVVVALSGVAFAKRTRRGALVWASIGLAVVAVVLVVAGLLLHGATG